MDNRITLQKSSLLPLVDKAASIIPSGGLPYTANLRIRAYPTYLRLESTDSEKSYSIILDGVDCSSEFEFFVPARKFQAIVRKCYLGSADLVVQGNELRVYSHNASWTVNLPTVRDFPSIQVECDNFQKVLIKYFLKALHYVKNSVSKDMARPYLRMVCVRDGKMTACDGIKFQQVDFPYPIEFDIPVHILPDLTHLMSSSEEEFALVGKRDNQTVFRVGALDLVTSKLSSRFPNVEQMMLRPAMENRSVLVVERRALINAVERAKLASDPDTLAVALGLSAGSVTVSSRDKDRNTATDTIPADWKGKAKTMVFSHATLLDLLKSYDFDKCTFYVGEDTKTVKSVLMLKSEELGSVGIIPQISSNLRVL